MSIDEIILKLRVLKDCEYQKKCADLECNEDFYGELLEITQSFKKIIEAYKDETMDYCSGYVRDIVAKEAVKYNVNEEDSEDDEYSQELAEMAKHLKGFFNALDCLGVGNVRNK